MAVSFDTNLLLDLLEHDASLRARAVDELDAIGDEASIYAKRCTPSSLTGSKTLRDLITFSPTLAFSSCRSTQTYYSLPDNLAELRTAASGRIDV